jgi:hypothetical protein
MRLSDPLGSPRESGWEWGTKKVEDGRDEGFKENHELYRIEDMSREWTKGDPVRQ